MEHLAEVLKLIEGGMARDPEKVASYAELLASKLHSTGDEGAAKRISRALAGRSMTLHQVDVAPKATVPVDGDSRVSVADVSYPILEDLKLVLPESAMAALDDFLSAYGRMEELLSAGLRGPGHLLLYGPPGCGKTQTAAFVAATLRMPLVTARLDGLISSYLGSTAKNVRALFEYVDRLPCVLFLDEFDAVAKMRDDPNELGELKRVVNSLLQNLDLLPSGTPVVAATNHAQLLDNAVWRRFEFHVEVPLPDQRARVELFRTYAGDDIGSVGAGLLAALTDGRSAADIRNACEYAKREQVLRPSNDEGDFSRVNLLLRFLSRTKDHSGGPGPTIDDQIRYLRAADPTNFSYSVIARILGVSKGKISKVLGSTRQG